MAIEGLPQVALLQADAQQGTLSLSSTVDMPGGCLPSSLAFDAHGRLWAAGEGPDHLWLGLGFRAWG